LFNQIISWKGSIWGVKESGDLYTLSDGRFLKKERLIYGNKVIQVRKLKILDNRLFVICNNNLFVKNTENDSVKCVMIMNPDISLHDVTIQDDSLLVATSEGLIRKPLFAKANNQSPLIVLNYFLIKNKKYPIGADNYRFKYNENNISINFSIISFHSDFVRSLEYSLNGASWVEISDQRKWLELQNLKPGKYELKLRGNNGIGKSAVQILKFEIKQPFWFQWWFILISLIAMGFVVYKFDRWRTASINRKSQEVIDRIELEKTANQSKLKAIKSQMNPHFFFNALNTIQSFILENDKKMAVTVLGKFSNLTRSMLEMSEKDEVTIAEEIKIIQLYLDIEKVRFNNDFDYNISTNNFDTELFKIPSLLLQPYIENAIKHGLLNKDGYKHLQISFNMENTELKIVIDDNGIGRKRSMELNAIKYKNHSSFATQAIEKRVKLLNEFVGRKITVEYIDKESENGYIQGTTVVIKTSMNTQ
jgi:hypothetical protein